LNAPTELRLILHRLNGIQQKIDQNLFDQFWIGCQFKTFRVHVHVKPDDFVQNLGTHELLNSCEKLPNGEDLEMGLRNAGEISIGINEMQQSFVSGSSQARCGYRL